LLIVSVAVRNAFGGHQETFRNELGAKRKTKDIVEDDCREENVPMISQVCHEEETVECGVCHTMYIKECHINMEPRNKPVKMKMCMSVPGDISCKDGYRRSCRTRYSTECGTSWEYQEIEEDRPVCGVHMVGKCKESEDIRTSDEDDDTPSRDCVEVPVMKCRIEKKMMRKRMPKTACRRIPRQFCMKRKCKPKKTKCFDKIHMISELTPVESCGYSPKKVCQETDDQEKTCRIVKRQVCKPDKESPKTVKRKICKQQNIVQTSGQV